jgi:hypothetical protein
LVLGVVVWIDEVVFIKSKGTRMPLIARIRADLGVLIIVSVCIRVICAIRVPCRLPLLILWEAGLKELLFEKIVVKIQF